MGRRKEIPILVYHEIIDNKNTPKELLSKMAPFYYVKKENFENQMAFLSANGFKTISLEELLSYLNNPLRNKSFDKSVVITFDDGYQGNYVYAFPALKKYNFSATFFITVNYIAKPFMMNWKQIEQMNKEGMSIQSHTMSHFFLKRADSKTLRKELSESKKILESRLGKKVHFISLPHGSANSQYPEVANELGYKGGCSSRIGFAYGDLDVYLLPRIIVDGRFNISQFRKIVEKDKCFISTFYLKKRLAGLTKNILGERIYDNIYNRIFKIDKSTC